MPLDTDMKVVAAELYFLPVTTRVPLKFGTETLTEVTCARVRLEVEGVAGGAATGWGETPLSVQWVWPATPLSYRERHEALVEFCLRLAREWAAFPPLVGHPIEIGHAFQTERLSPLLAEFNRERAQPLPWLAALVCCSPFDIALHDGYGNLHNLPIYEAYSRRYMSADLGHYLAPADGAEVSFSGKYPEDFLAPRQDRLPAWHLVGGLDAVEAAALDGGEPDDGHPVLLADWIRRDGLTCLKVKLRGDDADWDYHRLVRVGEIGVEAGVQWLTADFNCTVEDPAYVNGILDRLLAEQPRIYGMVLYVEQPFPYDLEANPIDVHSVSSRKPLFMDESAHDWEVVRLGRGLGWTGVALKTCKAQTGALLSLCWAKAHGMGLMVQDLTNPMLAQIPHLLLAAHAGTIMGVETNSMQFYPEASRCEEVVHPGLYRRRHGEVDLSSLKGPGFGYCVDCIDRPLPEPAVSFDRNG